MLFQLVAIVLGAIGVAIYFFHGIPANALTFISIAIFVLVDIYGLVTGQLILSVAVLLPIAPAILIDPWIIGLLLGLIAVNVVEVATEAILTRKLFQPPLLRPPWFFHPFVVAGFLMCLGILIAALTGE